MTLSIDLPHPTHHVTIIDHDSVQAALLHTQIVTALTDVVVDCVTVTSVDELPIAPKRQFDVIICDETCLALAGSDCLREIQLRRPGAAVIVAANTGTVQDAVDMMRHGARGFVEKADTPRLIRLIREELASAPLPGSSSGTIISGELTTTSTLVDLLDDMVDAAACVDLRERTIIYASAAFESVFGYPLRRLTEEPEFYRQVLHPDDVERVTAAMQDCLQTGSTDLEHRIIWPDGQVRWLHRKARVSFDSAGRPLLLKDSARDITERKQIEHTLAAVEAKERALLAAIPDIIFHLDAEDVILDVRGTIPDRGHPMLTLVGETMQGLLTKPLFPTDIIHQIIAMLAQVRSSRQTLTVEYRTVHQHQYEARFAPIGDTDEILALVRDITERKQAEHDLYTSREQYRSLLESSDAAITMLNADGHYLYLNAIAAQPFGVPADQLVGKTVFDLFPLDQANQTLRDLRAVFASNSGMSLEPQVSIGGQTHWFSTRIEPIRAADGKPYAALIHASEITARKLMELELRASEARYRSIVEDQTDLICRYDPDMRITFGNEAYCKSFGMKLDEVIGRSFFERIPPEEHEAARAYIQSLTRENPTAVSVHHSIHADGSMRWVEWRDRAIFDERGEIAEYQGVGRDITKQKRAEAALQGSYELLEQRVVERTAQLQSTTNRLEAIFQHSADAILLVDVTRGIQQANRAFGDLIGREADAILGRHLAGFCQPSATEQIEAAVRATVLGKQPQQIETRVLHADGSTRDVEMSLAPVNPSSHEVTSLVCIIRDMTAHKRAEAELLAQAQRLQLAAEVGGMGVWEWDIPSGLITGDDQMRALYGVTSEETMSILDVWASTLVHPEDVPRLQEEATYYLEHGSILDTHFRINPDNAPPRHVRLRAVMLRDSDGNPIRSIGINWDVTDEKAAAEALERALQREKELGELKSRFVSMASHEFRTPLASILATTDSLALYRSKMDETKIDERLNRIRQQVMQLTDLIEDMLQLARIQAGRVKFDPAMGDIGRLCVELIEEYDTQPDYQGRIIFEPDAAPVTASFDRRLLRQVIGNLLHNALKYSTAGQMVLIKVTQSECHFSITIKDEGIGVPQDDLKRLFEPFHRASNVGAIAGTGLGLSIALEAVELHGGAITVDSEVGTGTIFTVVLPKTQTQNDPNCAPTAETNEA